MKMFKSRSILYRYVVSFVSIAIFCCIIIGMASYLLAAEELRQSAADEQQRRLQLAAEDLYAQFDHLEEISHYVMTTACYAPSYFGRNPYYELELLEDLAKQKTFASIFDHIFLRYNGSPFVFTTTGKSWLEVFQDTLLTAEDVTQLPTTMEHASDLTFYPLKNGILAIYPLRFIRTSNYNGLATLSFYLPHSKVIERMQLVSSEKFSRAAVFYEDSCIMSTAEIDDPITVQYGGFRLVFDRTEIGTGVNRNFLHLSLWIILVFASLMCVLAIYAAFRNFRPIGNLARRHNVLDGANEIESLDKAISDIKGQLRISQEQLDMRLDQLRLLRSDLQKHFVLQVLRGHAEDNDLERMREAGMFLQGRRFHTFIVSCNTAAPNDVVHSFEELSDERAAFFAAPFGGEGRFAVLVNADECPDAADMLHDSCSGAKVFGGRSTDELSEIPALLFDALTEAEPSCIRPSDIARCREDERLRKFRKSLESGDEEQAIQSLHEYCAVYAGNDKTIAQMIYSNITSVLLAASYEANMNVPRAFLHGGPESQPMLEGWVSALCKGREVTPTSEEHQIIRYLREHALDYDLSLDRVSETFDRSARQIARIVQAETGGNYKEFILRIRMEHAKTMLREGASVAETCERVCYASRSHFIKTFTDYTGLTPSRWREQEQAKPTSNHAQQEG